MVDPIAEKLKEAIEESEWYPKHYSSAVYLWNGVNVWVGNNEHKPPNDGYHFIVNTPEGHKFSFNLRVEDGEPIVEQTWCE